MPNNISKIQIPAALTKKREFQFKQDTVSTATFLQSQPDGYLWTVPFQDVEIKLDSFTRCAPLNLPTFGRITMTHRAFFVKFKDIFAGWNETYTRNIFIEPHNRTNDTYKVTANDLVPIVTQRNLMRVFQRNTELANTTTGNNWDIFFRDFNTPSNSEAYILTKQGRLLYKVLNGLGYTLGGDINTEQTFNTLPLLAYCKIMAENYFPSNWKNNKIYTDMISILKQTQIAASTTQLEINESELLAISRFLMYANGYDGDYFVSSYLNHVVDNDNAFPAIAVNTDSNINVTQQTPDSPPSISTRITENAINTLQRVTAYMKINSLAGTDTYERLYAMFGYRSDNQKAIHFGSDEYTIQVGDIQSTADTANGNTGATLGSFAGKGVGGNKDRIFKYKCDGDCGIIIIVKTVTPHIGYVQGWDRHNAQTQILQFWHPLYDALGDQSIAKGELYSLPDGNTHNDWITMISEFGKIPRNAHYKIGHDLCIGDFQLHSRNTGMNAWHMFREMGLRSSVPSTSLNFSSAADENQFLRIFQNNGLADTFEPFNCVSNYTIRTYAPMRNLWDDTCLDQLQHEGGENHTFEPGGSKMY